ncbi:hypothetical protein O181_029744 [Austropuccinia psidii MF-1]|uniref:Uncharacterized protein n=1 Tax=Austropuccinia psidii MF-1 TaxID=1389203 RepID=A0A9Q3H4V4_9BASI|nr:hypothetical protein [Austropuccinia psidii MF-1]
MFGEDDSESPRRPSPWLPSPDPSIPAVGLENDLSKSEIKFDRWPDELEPELDELGHIEYKLKILNPTPSRFQKLKTQMKWRLLEGGGTALYELGVLDDGTLIGLSRQEMDESLVNLARIAHELDCQLELLRVIELPDIIVNTGPSSRPTAKIPPSIRIPGGVDRKEKAKQKRKKKKSRAKPITVPLPGLAKTPKGKLRIEPGDAAVSSASEPSSPSKALFIEAHTVVASESQHSKKNSINSIRSIRDRCQLSPRRAAPIAPGNFADQICLLTPEERSILRRARKNERKAAMAVEARRAKARAESPPTSSVPWPHFKDEDLGGWKRQAEDKNETKYVVEVRVAKEVHHEEERFLDFEGFGISDSS